MRVGPESPFAYGLNLTSDAEAKVRLSGPTRKALTRGVVLFASVLSNAFYLTRDKPACGRGAGSNARGAFWLDPPRQRLGDRLRPRLRVRHPRLPGRGGPGSVEALTASPPARPCWPEWPTTWPGSTWSRSRRRAASRSRAHTLLTERAGRLTTVTSMVFGNCLKTRLQYLSTLRTIPCGLC